MNSLHLLYHELRPCKSNYSYVVETTQFKNHVDLFVHLRKSATPGLWPEVTFDDGHLSNYEYALPILCQQDMKARFFITAGWIGSRPGYMGWNEVRALHEAGQSIGAHGWSHSLLTHCTDIELQTEIRGARLLLEDKLGIPITTMSFPGGRFNQRVLSACYEAGYTQLYTSIPRAEPFPTGSMVGRLNIRGDMNLPWIASLFQAGNTSLTRLTRQYQIKAAAKTLLGDRVYAALWSLLNRKEPGTDSV